jgi:hypothetical protein
VTKLKILASIGALGIAVTALAIAGSAAAGEHAARLAAQEICAWQRGTEPEAALDEKLGMGRASRAFLVRLRDERSAIDCVPTGSSYTEAIAERAVAIRVHGRDVVHFRIAPMLGGPKVLGYWTEAP